MALIAAATSLDEAVCTTTRRCRARACLRASAERLWGRDCPCSVREQPPTPADSNQERAGNVVKLSEVTGASWSLSPSQAGFKSAASASSAIPARSEFASLWLPLAQAQPSPAA